MCYINTLLIVVQKLQWQLAHKTYSMLHEKLQTHVGYYNVSKYKLGSDIL
jgi:hypothetical protein